MSIPPASLRACLRVLLLLLVALSACAAPQLPTESIEQLAPAQRPRLTAVAADANSEFYLVDQLVRATSLEAIDLHLRYVERRPDALILHVSFYNNGANDLASVSGVDPRAARLEGDTTVRVIDVSPSLQQGIMPPTIWLSGGATVGWLAFEPLAASSLRLVFPGFPPLAFDLDQPLAQAPEPSPPSPGVYRYDLAVSSDRLTGIELQIRSAEVRDRTLTLTIAFVNRNPEAISFQSSLSGRDAVLLDERWQQYRPTQVDPALAEGIGPAQVWEVDQAQVGTLVFALPVAGESVLFHFPSYPLVRLPLRADQPAAIATTADLPPSVRPRPTPLPVPTSTPLSPQQQARADVSRLLQRLNAALARGDQATYLQGFAPELRAEQAALLERLNRLPIEGLRFELVGSPPPDALSADGATIGAVPVELQYRVREVDPANLFSADLTLTLRRAGEAWQISALEGQLPFWATGETAARRTGAFWIFYRPEMTAELPLIEQEAQAAFEQVVRRLPDRVQPLNVMFITTSSEGFKAQTDRDAHQFLGVAVARYRFDGVRITIANRAFYLNGAAFRDDPAQDRQRTIAHELVHLMLAPQTMPFTPAWLSEGAAMFYTDDFPAATLGRWLQEEGADALSLTELSRYTSFGASSSSTGEQTAVFYAYSAYLARYLIATYGEAALLRFYDSFAALPAERILAALPPGADGAADQIDLSAATQTLTAELVPTAFGVDLATLEADYERWLADTLE